MKPRFFPFSLHPSSFQRYWPYLFVCLTPLFLFAPFLLGWQVLYWGTPLFQFYPWRKFALDTLLSGHLPLWNPYLGNGAPLIANLQSAVFYPPNWLAFILPLDYSMSWLVVLHLIWAGAGMVILTRALGFKPLGQVVAGLAFGLSQYLVARAWFFSINAAVAWVPWIIWAGERIVNPKSKIQNLKFAWWLALFVALQLLAGHAQTSWYTLLLLAAWVVWRLVTLSPCHPVKLLSFAIRHFAFLSFIILFAFALAALQLLPAAELLQQSPRAASADYEFVMTYSFSPWRLLTLVAPDLLGNPARGTFYGYGNYWEDAVYVGLLPVLLAGAVLWQTLKSLLNRPMRQLPNYPTSQAPVFHSSLVIFSFAILFISLLLALGRNTPVFPLLYRYVPTFNLFQAPARMMLWFVFALALLAGVGADGWQRPEGAGRRWLERAWVGSVSVFLTGAIAFAVSAPVNNLAELFRQAAFALAVLGAGLFVFFFLSLLRPADDLHPSFFILHPFSITLQVSPFTWELAVAVFLSIDLIFAGYGLNPGAPPDLYRTSPSSGAALRAAIGDHRLYQFPADEYHVKYEQLLSFKSFGPPELAYTMRAAQLTNATLLNGLAAANNFDPLESARYAEWMTVVSDTQSLALLRLMDVGAIASSVPLDLAPIISAGPVTFYRVPGDVRRGRVVYSAHLVADAAAARAALADFDPDREVILEADDPGGLATQPLADSLTGSPNAVTIPVTLSQPGWFILSDTYYPGWVAFVDGRPAPLLRANYAFRAVAVDAGAHTVDFRYEPQSFLIGLWLSGASWLVFLGAGLWLLHRSRLHS